MGTASPTPKSGESATFTPERDTSSPPDVRLVHYNDVYHLDPSSAEPVGGAARFQTVINEYREGAQYRGQSELVTLFSGDAFNPSLESSVTKGSHMVPILNNLGTACSTIGNHDLDFGVQQLEYLVGKCTFPWLCANILDPALGDDVPIGHAKKTHMITLSNGIKIGLLGLGEREWLDTINSLPPNLIYKSATETAKELIPKLRKDGADMVIILAHAREPNDVKLAENLAGEADLILGGHDHYYSHQLIKGTHVLRSGSDFKQLSYIEAWKQSGSQENGGISKWDFSIRRRDIVGSIEAHQPTVDLIEELTSKLKDSLEKAVGWTAAPLDARFVTVRLKESNMGNFVCDIMRHHYEADCVIMASGTIRGDQVYPPGPIRVKDITDCFPFEDPVVVLRVTGQAILDALENGVSLYPALEGRFPQVSNIKFEFDPSRPAGSRITKWELGGQSPVDLEKMYILCTRGYMARGKDGFTSLLAKSEGGVAEEIVDEESGVLISMLLRQYFMSLKVLDQWTHWSPTMEQHWSRVVTGVDASHPHVEPGPGPVSGPGPLKQSSPQLLTQPGPAFVADEDGSNFKAWNDWSAVHLRERRAAVMAFNERVVDNATALRNAEEMQEIERQMSRMRRVARKWMRLAGVQSQPADTLADGEFEVDWTKAIAPRLEGRIRNVGKQATQGQ